MTDYKNYKSNLLFADIDDNFIGEDQSIFAHRDSDIEDYKTLIRLLVFALATDKQYTCYQLKYRHGVPVKDIASFYGISPSAVSQSVSSLENKLACYLERYKNKENIEDKIWEVAHGKR